jgi:hypothetical protein
MESKDLNSWEEFKDYLGKIQEETQRLKTNRCNGVMVTEPLYRGQCNDKWRLESTLERKCRNVSLYEYLVMIEGIKSNVEQTSGISWPKFPDLNECKLLSIYQFAVHLYDNLGYMYFLRQHGFPSPLLDWTDCPYIASYFAFESVDIDTKRVAIYFFRKQTGAIDDMKSVLKPTMDSLGPDVSNTSPRHFKQKAQYTLCAKNTNIRESRESLKHYIVANMEEDINNPGFYIKDNDVEDIPEAGNVVRKYTIPVTEKKKVLKELELKGINRKSLFESTPDNILIDLWNKIEM